MHYFFKQKMQKASFKITFKGIGFDNKLADKNQQHTEPPKQTIITELSGPGKLMTFLLNIILLPNLVYTILK
jgi:hypothetical protein